MKNIQKFICKKFYFRHIFLRRLTGNSNEAHGPSDLLCSAKYTNLGKRMSTGGFSAVKNPKYVVKASGELMSVTSSKIVFCNSKIA